MISCLPFFLINDHIRGLGPPGTILLKGTMKFASFFRPSVTKKAILDLLTPGLRTSCPIWVFTYPEGIPGIFFVLRLFEAFLVQFWFSFSFRTGAWREPFMAPLLCNVYSTLYSLVCLMFHLPLLTSHFPPDIPVSGIGVQMTQLSTM